MNSKISYGNKSKLKENQTKTLKPYNKTQTESNIKNYKYGKSQKNGGLFGRNDAKNERASKTLTKNSCSRHTLPKIKEVQCRQTKIKTESIKSNTSVKTIVAEISRSYDELIKSQDSESKPFVPFLYPYQARFQRNFSAANKNAQMQRKNLIIPRQKCSRRKKRPGNFVRMNTEDNGNVGLLKPTSSSNEDLSEYTDADESISAPTEFLAEFLSAVMLKDYETALKYCKLILQYEPNNITAKEFYPLIIEKLKQMNTEEGSGNDSEDEENDNSSSTTSSESDSSSSSNSNSDESSEDQEDDDGVEMGQEADKRSKSSSDGDATTGSYSSLEDDEAETDQLAALAAKYQIDNVNLGNGNKIYTTNLTKPFDNKVTNANMPFGTSSDSESPTEPVSQQTVAMLRAKVVPTNI